MKKGEFAKREKPKATMKDLLTMGVFNAVGVSIVSSGSGAGAGGGAGGPFGDEPYLSEELEKELSDKQRQLSELRKMQQVCFPCLSRTHSIF